MFFQLLLCLLKKSLSIFRQLYFDSLIFELIKQWKMNWRIAVIPARIDNTPPAKTSVTISRSATHDAFDVEIPFFSYNR